MYQNQPPQGQWQAQQPAQPQYQPPVQQASAPVANLQQNEGTSNLVQGRILWMVGTNLPEGRQKINQDSGQVEIDPKTGNPAMEYGFGLAVAKNSPEFQKIMGMLTGEAFKMYPSGQIPPTFAMKYKDGDKDVDERGVPYSTREGYLGHIVVACTTRLPIKLFKWENGQNVMINSGVKSGDYVTVQLNIKAHPPVGRGKAGLYVNPSAVQLIAPGKEIINTPSGDQMFGTVTPQFQGQIVADTGPAFPMQGAPAGQPPMQQQAWQQPAPGYAQGQPAMPPQAAPHYGVVPDQFQQNPAQHQQAPQQQQWNQPPVQPQQQWGQPAMPPVPQR